ncbi:SsgA family sporulation/cell division regulator, partial [Streptomyces spectabilis]
MSGHQPSVRDDRPARHGVPELALGIERVLGVSARQPVRAAFRFDPRAPLVVSAEFVVENGPRVLWRIGRDLLWQGLRAKSGTGDVRMRPSHQEHRHHAGSPDDRATAWLQLATGDVAALFELPVPP